MDYLVYYFNSYAYCGAVETLLDLEVPRRPSTCASSTSSSTGS